MKSTAVTECSSGKSVGNVNDITIECQTALITHLNGWTNECAQVYHDPVTDDKENARMIGTSVVNCVNRMNMLYNQCKCK